MPERFTADRSGRTDKASVNWRTGQVMMRQQDDRTLYAGLFVAEILPRLGALEMETLVRSIDREFKLGLDLPKPEPVGPACTLRLVRPEG